MAPVFPEFGVSPDDLPSVVAGLRGVAQVDVIMSDSLVTVSVLTEPSLSDQTHWLELLERTILLLARSTYRGDVTVMMRPNDTDLDASLDR
jgi:hypothetical protein